MEDVSHGEVPLLVAYNGLKYDIPVTFQSCLKSGLAFPLHWYFMDSLHLARNLYKGYKARPDYPKDFKQVNSFKLLDM